MNEPNKWQNWKSSLSHSNDFSFISFLLVQDLSFSVLSALGLKVLLECLRGGDWGFGLSPCYRGGVEAQRTLWEVFRDKPKAVCFGGGRMGQWAEKPLEIRRQRSPTDRLCDRSGPPYPSCRGQGGLVWSLSSEASCQGEGWVWEAPSASPAADLAPAGTPSPVRCQNLLQPWEAELGDETWAGPGR